MRKKLLKTSGVGASFNKKQEYLQDRWLSNPILKRQMAPWEDTVMASPLDCESDDEGTLQDLEAQWFPHHALILNLREVLWLNLLQLY